MLKLKSQDLSAWCYKYNVLHIEIIETEEICGAFVLLTTSGSIFKDTEYQNQRPINEETVTLVSGLKIHVSAALVFNFIHTRHICPCGLTGKVVLMMV